MESWLRNDMVVIRVNGKKKRGFGTGRVVLLGLGKRNRLLQRRQAFVCAACLCIGGFPCQMSPKKVLTEGFLWRV